MEGMSDTAIDAELYCRLHALNRIRFREDPKAENVFGKQPSRDANIKKCNANVKKTFALFTKGP